MPRLLGPPDPRPAPGFGPPPGGHGVPQSVVQLGCRARTASAGEEGVVPWLRWEAGGHRPPLDAVVDEAVSVAPDFAPGDPTGPGAVVEHRTPPRAVAGRDPARSVEGHAGPSDAA